MNDLPKGYDAWKTASPYDEYDDMPDNSHIAEAFPDYASIGELYRAVYRYTACGPSIGVTIVFEEEPDDFDFSPDMAGGEQTRTLYCDDLYKLGTWKELDEQGVVITEISVSSIVEGVDQCTDTHYIDCDGLTFEPADIRNYFWDAVEAVNLEAHEIWQETHGCETCAKHWHSEGHTLGEWGSFEGCDGITPIWPDCPDCEGSGAII